MPEPIHGPQVKDADAMINDFFSTPLFMTETPKDVNDPPLLAIQSLLYDGEPDQVAENFKNQGNECIKNGQFREALNYYEQGLEVVKDPIQKSLLLSNAAAAHLKLGNFKMALSHTAQSIKLDHTNLKAFYRSIKALVALDKIDDAIQVCEMVLEKHSDFVKEMEYLKDLKRKQDQKLKEREERAQEKLKKGLDLVNAIKSRNIKVYSRKSQGSSILSSFHSEHHVVLNEDGSLSWPVLFLYPEFQESDFITSFDENTTFLDHLKVMFQESPPWDAKNDYDLSNLQVYFETRGTEKVPAKLFKISRNMKLNTVLSNSNYTVVDGIPTFFIVSTASEFTQKFIASYK